MAFLVFEGLDGSGKSTLIRGLCETLNQQSIDYHLTREPGGTELGEELRTLILRTGHEAPTPRAELLLYQAIRAQHVDLVIEPCLKKGQWVLSDRFTASTYAFQVSARGLNSKDVEWLNAYAAKDVAPDLTVLLDLPTEKSAERMKQREDESGAQKDRFELEKKDFHEKVRQGYLHLSRRQPEKWLVLDACKKPEELLQELLEYLREKQWLRS
ncbi:MAG: dTMP kinase [Bdellovibrionales bacterium]|nr:dTMP kinase [Bdellovibrionales bacterium]